MSENIDMKELLNRLSEDEKNLNLPDNFYQTMLEQLLEREYLNDTADRCFFLEPKAKRAPIHWMQITRLPIHPNENESYDLLSRWQGVLTSLHAWGYRLLFLLLRHEGKTKLFWERPPSNSPSPRRKRLNSFGRPALAPCPVWECGFWIQRMKYGMPFMRRFPPWSPLVL